jgi:protein TonB
VLIALVLLSLTGAAVLGGMTLIRTPAAAKRQTARIMILPDTPPPPPPEPDRKPPPPKEQAMAQPINQPKQQEPPPEPAQLKMEGQAGEGPSAFASGEVKQDYIGGDVGRGDRYSAYVARLEQRIQNELSRRKLRVTNVKVFLWLSPDGAVERYSIEGADDATERNLRSALGDVHRLDEAPLPDMPMPVGLQIN